MVSLLDISSSIRVSHFTEALEFIAFLDKIEEIGSSVFPTYDPNKLLDPEWNGWKQWFNTDPKVNVYVYVHQKDVLNDGSVSYEIRMSWSCLQTKQI